MVYCYVVCSEQNEMKMRIRLLDVLHWQLKRCVNGSRCKACCEADTLSEVNGIEHLSLSDIDQPPANSDQRPLTYVAGVDISYVKNDDVNACAACVVVKLPNFDVRIFITLSIIVYLLTVTLRFMILQL